MGAIVPFASGTPVALATTALGVADTGAVLGFGSNLPAVSLVTGTIDLTSLTNFAFSMPRAGTIESISVTYSNVAEVTLLGPATITAQLYSAAADSNDFTPIEGASVGVVIPGTLDLGTMASAAASDLGIAVAAGTRLLLVVSLDVAGITAAAAVTGYVSAGAHIL